MERVKLTFEKSERGDRVTIQKDGGFTVEDVSQLTEMVEEMFNGPELEKDEVIQEKAALSLDNNSK